RPHPRPLGAAVDRRAARRDPAADLSGAGRQRLRRAGRPPPRVGRASAWRDLDRRRRGHRMIVSVFAYTVDPAGREAFERVYGPDGEWARFFVGAEGYLGTELLLGDEYLVIDRWSSEATYDAFLT